eukprot:scaffold94642_cov19-Tisochrysis_lutea.AAC.1
MIRACSSTSWWRARVDRPLFSRAAWIPISSPKLPLTCADVKTACSHEPSHPNLQSITWVGYSEMEAFSWTHAQSRSLSNRSRWWLADVSFLRFVPSFHDYLQLVSACFTLVYKGSCQSKRVTSRLRRAVHTIVDPFECLSKGDWVVASSSYDASGRKSYDLCTGGKLSVF